MTQKCSLYDPDIVGGLLAFGMRHVSLVGLLQRWEHHVPVGCW